MGRDQKLMAKEKQITVFQDRNRKAKIAGYAQRREGSPLSLYSENIDSESFNGSISNLQGKWTRNATSTAKSCIQVRHAWLTRSQHTKSSGSRDAKTRESTSLCKYCKGSIFWKMSWESHRHVQTVQPAQLCSRCNIRSASCVLCSSVVRLKRANLTLFTWCSKTSASMWAFFH